MQNYKRYQGKCRVFSVVRNIPEFSVGIQMKRSVSVSFDRNIRDHLWRWYAPSSSPTFCLLHRMQKFVERHRDSSAIAEKPSVIYLVKSAYIDIL